MDDEERHRHRIEKDRRYNAEHREERREYSRKYAREHKDERLAYQRRYRKEHPEVGKKSLEQLASWVNEVEEGRHDWGSDVHAFRA